MPGRQYRQHIPRPNVTLPGGIAPWAVKAGGQRRPIALAQISGAVAPILRPPDEEPDERPVAAVLVPLFELDGETSVLLIRRSSLLSSNPGDIAFPGGRLEPGESAVGAALREAEEEVALPAASVHVLGRMDMVHRARKGGRIAPYLGVLAAPPVDLKPQPHEVDEVIVVSLTELAEEGAYWEEQWEIPGEGRRALSFFAHPSGLGDDVIWGMTAAILRQLLSAVLFTSGSGAS